MNKQIEEKQDLTEIIYMSGYGLLLEDCVSIAEQIQEQGYRQASEVAREIFAELKTVMMDEYRYPIIAELKKEYGVTQE